MSQIRVPQIRVPQIRVPQIRAGAPARALVMTLSAGVTLGGLATVADAAPAKAAHSVAKPGAAKPGAARPGVTRPHTAKPARRKTSGVHPAPKRATHRKHVSHKHVSHKQAATHPVPVRLVQPLRALRGCESGGNYATNTGNGYYGAYQFSLGTWRGMGYAGSAASSPAWQQDEAVLRLHARSGWSPWPGCARALGLT
jgi:hypothetical protein